MAARRPEAEGEPEAVPGSPIALRGARRAHARSAPPLHAGPGDRCEQHQGDRPGCADQRVAPVEARVRRCCLRANVGDERGRLRTVAPKDGLVPAAGRRIERHRSITVASEHDWLSFIAPCRGAGAIRCPGGSVLRRCRHRPCDRRTHHDCHRRSDNRRRPHLTLLCRHRFDGPRVREAAEISLTRNALTLRQGAWTGAMSVVALRARGDGVPDPRATRGEP